MESFDSALRLLRPNFNCAFSVSIVIWVGDREICVYQCAISYLGYWGGGSYPLGPSVHLLLLTTKSSASLVNYGNYYEALELPCLVTVCALCRRLPPI